MGGGRIGLGSSLPCAVQADWPALAFRTLVAGVTCAADAGQALVLGIAAGPIVGWTPKGRPLWGGWLGADLEANLAPPALAAASLRAEDALLLSIGFRSFIHTDKNLSDRAPSENAGIERGFALLALWESSLDVGLAVPLGERDALKFRVRQTLAPLLRRFGYAGVSSSAQFRLVEVQWRRAWELSYGSLHAGAGVGHLIAEFEALQFHSPVPTAHLSYTWY